MPANINGGWWGGGCGRRSACRRTSTAAGEEGFRPEAAFLRRRGAVRGQSAALPPGAAFLPSRPVPDGREGSSAAQSGTSSQSAGPRRSRGKFCRRARHFFPHDPPTGREWEEAPPNPPPHPPTLTSARATANASRNPPPRPPPLTSARATANASANPPCHATRHTPRAATAAGPPADRLHPRARARARARSWRGRAAASAVRRPRACRPSARAAPRRHCGAAPSRARCGRA
jgi:hypothetical protein